MAGDKIFKSLRVLLVSLPQEMSQAEEMASLSAPLFLSQKLKSFFVVSAVRSVPLLALHSLATYNKKIFTVEKINIGRVLGEFTHLNGTECIGNYLRGVQQRYPNCSFPDQS